MFSKAAISRAIPWMDKISERFAVADISNVIIFLLSISISKISSISNPLGVNLLINSSKSTVSIFISSSIYFNDIRIFKLF